MSYFKHNLEYIKKYHFYLYSKVKQKKNFVLEDSVSVWSEHSKRKGETLFIKKGEETIRLNSYYNPAEEASIWADQYEFQNMGMYCAMFGFGNGSFARALVQKMRTDTIFIILEPSISVFLHVMEHYDLSDILKRKNILITIEGINDNDLHYSLLQGVHSYNLRTGMQLVHPKYDNIYPYRYLNFLEEVKYGQENTVSNIATAIVLGISMLSGILMNLKNFALGNTVNDFIGVFPKDMPVIIVAAGPSIKKNISDLKKAKGKALIIAVDRILDFLLDNGVKPDMVAMMDPQKPEEMFSTRGIVDIPVLTAIEANPNNVNLSKGKKIFTMASEYPQKLCIEIGIKNPYVITGTSVATMICSVCLHWGIRNIILAGQDLSYNEKHETHGGCIQEEYTEIGNLLIDGIYGGKVESRGDWFRMLTWYEDLINLNKKLNLIDATEGGALIKGSIVMTLKDAVDKYGTKERDYEKLVDKIKPSLDQNKRKMLLSCLQEDYKELTTIRREAKRGRTICKHCMQSSMTDKKEMENLQKMKEINQYISDTRVNDLLEWGVSSIADAKLLELYKFTDDEEENKQKTLEQSEIIYDATCMSVDFTRKYMKKTIKSMSDVIAEGEKE